MPKASCYYRVDKHYMFLEMLINGSWGRFGKLATSSLSPAGRCGNYTPEGKKHQKATVAVYSKQTFLLKQQKSHYTINNTIIIKKVFYERIFYMFFVGAAFDIIAQDTF